MASPGSMLPFDESVLDLYQCDCQIPSIEGNRSPQPPCSIAIDGEMVFVGVEERRLARFSVVNCQGETLFNEYVQVEEPVTDYCTHISSIEPEHITPSSGAWKIDAVRDEIIRRDWFTCSSKIIGHNIQNDLDGLGMQPDDMSKVRDTTKCILLCPNPNRPLGLRMLAFTRLGIEMQDSKRPHDSVIDAKTTMQLYLSVKKEWEEMIDQEAAAAAAQAIEVNAEEMKNDEDIEDEKKEHIDAAGDLPDAELEPVRRQRKHHRLRHIVMNYTIGDIFAAAKLDDLSHVPESFESASQYGDVFRPLVVEENRTSARKYIEDLSVLEEREIRDTIIDINLSTMVKPISHDEGECLLRLSITERDQRPAALKKLLPNTCLMILTQADSENLPERIKAILSSDPASSPTLDRCVPNFTTFPRHIFGLIRCEVPEKRRKDPNGLEYAVIFSDETARIFFQDVSLENKFCCTVINTLTSDQRADDALQWITEGVNRPRFFERIINGQIDDTVMPQEASDYTHYDKLRRYCNTLQLNSSQEEAILNAAVLQQDIGVQLIKGPPGTGQTETHRYSYDTLSVLMICLSD